MQLVQTLAHLGHDHATDPHTFEDYMLMGLAVLGACVTIFIARSLTKAVQSARQAKVQPAKQRI